MTQQINLNLTIHDRFNNIEKEIQSDSFQVQKLYFDVFSEHVNDSTRAVLDNSIPDIQLLDLIHDLESFLKTRKDTLSNPEEKKIRDILASLHQAKDISCLISSIIFTSSTKGKIAFQKALKEMLQKKISSLANQEKLIIPIGYMNGDVYNLQALSRGKVGGHALALEIHRNKNQFKISIFNGGEGLESHQQDKKTEKFYPLCYGNIPRNRIINSTFVDELVRFSCNAPYKSQYSAIDIYQCLDKQLRAYQTSPTYKPYREQRIGNCPKKCWQIWVHRQLKDHEAVYRKFRCFRLNQSIQSVEKICRQTQNQFCYSHSLARMGFSESSNRIYSIVYGILAKIRGDRLYMKIPKTELQILINDAKTTLQKRIQKVQKFFSLNPCKRLLENPSFS
ncbi:MAG: hypothetical protein FJZ64_02910 [Chlamydiae bacterium]|nr:hypothetical protein [Chlamydiota bacterium]